MHKCTHLPPEADSVAPWSVPGMALGLVILLLQVHLGQAENLPAPASAAWPDGVFLSAYGLIATADEMRMLDTLPPQAREHFLRLFWKKRDPTPTTDTNESMHQFHDRVATALARFAAPGSSPPWDDRGDVYIRFGPPDDLEPRVENWYAPMDTIKMNHGMPDPNEGKKDYGELWYYFSRNLKLQFQGYETNYKHVPFVDQKREYQLPKDFEDDRQQIDTTLFQYSPPEGVQFAPVALEVYPFRRADGSYDVYLTTAVPLAFVCKKSNAAERKISYAERISVFNDTLSAVWSDHKKRRGTFTGDTRGLLAQSEWYRTLPSGQYVFAVEIEDEDGKRRSVGACDRILVPYLQSVELDLSPLVVAFDIGSPGTATAGFVRNGKAIRPMPGGVFKGDQDVHFYHEVYNLTMDTAGIAHYKMVLKLYNVRKKEVRTLASKILESPTRETYQAGSLRHESLKHGEYILEVSTTDLLGQTTKTALAEFKIE